ncbi:MAG: hypothetical protein NTW86_23465 [Candidatus Sumerlaeota bacterium]|nr:hypothetical protein [Candidatus Sumerlaeota bacterium]
MNESLRRNILSVPALIIALALLLIGALRSYEVQAPASANPTPAARAPMPPFVVAPDGSVLPPGFPAPAPPKVTPAPPRIETIRDPMLVINATYGGVTRKEGALVFTADPSSRQGKQACPT